MNNFALVEETEKELKSTPYDGPGKCLGIDRKTSSGFIGNCSESEDGCLVSSRSLDCEVSQVCCHKLSIIVRTVSDDR